MFFILFFTAVVERLVLQTIYVLDKEILKFFGLKSAVSNQERVIMARILFSSICGFFEKVLRRMV